MKNMNILVGVLTSKIFEMFSFKIGIQKKAQSNFNTSTILFIKSYFSYLINVSKNIY